MEIREAINEDLNQIIAIEEECFPESEAAKGEDIRKRFFAFKENFFVAVEDGEVVAFLNSLFFTYPLITYSSNSFNIRIYLILFKFFN